MKLSIHRPSAIVLSLAAAFAAPSWSALVTIDLDASSSASANGIAGTTSSYPSPGYVNSYTYAYDGVNSGNGSAFSNQYGAYAVGSNASGIGTGNANASLNYTITNDTGVAQNYTMTFKIYGGSINTNLNYGATLTGSESLMASYAASIKVNGTSAFSSSSSITRTASGISTTQNGVDLSGGSDDGSDGYYYWASQYLTIDLGTVAAGANVTVLAELAQSSLANVGDYAYDNGNSDYGCYNTLAATIASRISETNCQQVKGGAYGFYGDPADFSEAGINDPVVISASTVPEPGSLALALSALGGLAVARKRRKG